MATQVTGELYRELDGQLFEIKRQLRQSAGYPFDPSCLRVALQDAIEGKFNKPKTQKEAKTEPPILTFAVVATTALPALASKKTKRCFVGGIWNPNWRDGDLDRWLLVNQPATDACIVTTLASKKDGWTFAEAAAEILGTGADTGTSILGKLLIDRGHAITLAQAEEMAERTEKGEPTGMKTDGYANFFFVETGNPEDPVSVGSVYRVGRDWLADVCRLDNGYRWFSALRLLVRNVDTSKLGA